MCSLHDVTGLSILFTSKSLLLHDRALCWEEATPGVLGLTCVKSKRLHKTYVRSFQSRSHSKSVTCCTYVCNYVMHCLLNRICSLYIYYVPYVCTYVHNIHTYIPTYIQYIHIVPYVCTYCMVVYVQHVTDMYVYV